MTRTLREVEIELARRRHADPLETVYKPYPQGLLIHRSRKDTLILGGNRSGKSWAMNAEAQFYATGRAVHAEIPEPPNLIWYTLPSRTMFNRSIKPIFKRLAPNKELKRFYENDAIAVYKNGSELHFVSADMKQRRLQGASITLGILDETPEKEIYDELVARVADQRERGSRLIIGYAPLPENAAKTMWVRDEIYLPIEIGERADWDIINMPIADRDGHSLVPHFTDEDIKELELKWPDPAVRAARLYGEIVSRTGLVFKSFDPDVHLISPFKIPDEYTRWFVVDPEYHRFAALFFAADEQGRYIVTDEYFSQDEPLAHRAERLSIMAGERKLELPVFVDSANPQDAIELNWHFQRIGAPLGAQLLPFVKKVEDMILRTHAMLEPDPDVLYPRAVSEQPLYGSPRMLFFDTLISRWDYEGRRMDCSRLLWELQRLAWDKSGRPDKNSAGGADCLDCLIYGSSIPAMGRPAPVRDWKRSLPLGDALLWRAIERADRRYDRAQED